MRVTSDDLLQALAIIDNVPSRAGIPPSEFIKVKAGKAQLSLSLSADVFGTVSIPGDVTENWIAFLDRSSFVPFVRASKELGSKVAFVFKRQEKSGRVVVKCGSRFGYFNKVTNVSGYSEVANVPGIKTKLSSVQRAHVKLAAQYATPDPTVAYLNCVFFGKDGGVLASNERSAIRIESKSIGRALPIPLGILNTLDHEAVKSVVLGETHAKVNFTIGYICQTVNQKTVKQFPVVALTKAMETAKGYPKRFSIDAKSLAGAIIRLGNYSSAVLKREAIVKVVGVKGEASIALVCHVPQGHFTETVPLKKELTSDFEAEWLLNLMLPLATLDDARYLTVRFENKSTPYLVYSKGMSLLVSRRTT